MAVEYRPMRWEEEGSAVQLWMSALETDEYEALQTFRDFSTNPQRFDQSYVAVADDGAVLATVCYWLRDVRDITGQPVRIGHLYHVATHPAARRQGHAGKLLTHTIRALHCARCTWAILSARQDAVPLYRRYGWQAVPRGYIAVYMMQHVGQAHSDIPFAPMTHDRTLTDGSGLPPHMRQQTLAARAV